MLSIILPSHRESAVKDFSREVQAMFPGAEVLVSEDEKGQGKGWAIREALAWAKGDQVAFLDGDGEIPARMLKRFIPFLEDFDAVVGSKRITKSPLRRKIMTRVTRLWFKILFGVKVDTQTGIKLFRRSALDAIDNCWESNGFIFDAEVIARLQRQGLRMIEVPVECEIRRQLAFKTILRIFGESLWLKFRLLSRRER